jgi:hypothetical protein
LIANFNFIRVRFHSVPGVTGRSRRESATSMAEKSQHVGSSKPPIVVGTPSSPVGHSNAVFKHAKYIALGGAGVWYLDLVDKVQQLVYPTAAVETQWARSGYEFTS